MLKTETLNNIRKYIFTQISKNCGFSILMTSDIFLLYLNTSHKLIYIYLVYTVLHIEGQPRPKYIFNKCGTNIYFFTLQRFGPSPNSKYICYKMVYYPGVHESCKNRSGISGSGIHGSASDVHELNLVFIGLVYLYLLYLVLVYLDLVYMHLVYMNVVYKDLVLMLI